MAQITAIKPQKKPGKFNLFLDGKFAFSLKPEVIVRENLRVNLLLKEEEVERLIRENEIQINLDRVYNFLSFRPRSKKEILDFFKRKKLGDQTQKVLLKKLEDQKVINDLDFARWWVEQRKTFRPRGKQLLKIELRQKGIDKGIIEKVLFSNPESEIDLAVLIIEKKYSQGKSLSKEELKKKIYGFLLRRGFSYEVIRKAIEKIQQKR